MYDTGFYDTIRAGCRASAEVLAPLIADMFHPTSVVDVGCGEGWWGTSIARSAGISPHLTVGIDGPGVPETSPIHTHGTFVESDLRQPIMTNDFDLAVCLEVAEHLPPSRAESFVAELCALAPVVVFSAAIPGQGGTGHVNEQWPGYWADLFESCGYDVTGDLRLETWEDDRIENWYRQNLLLAVATVTDDLAERFDFDSPVLPLVHPVLYDARRHR